MADTKWSAEPGAAAVTAADIIMGLQSGAAVKYTAAQLATFILTASQLSAGSATAGSWPTLGSGTLLTAAVAGTLERDTTNFYMTTDAGNRGIVSVVQFIRANATRTFASNTTQQAIFSSPTNGALSLTLGVYEFEAVVGMDTMSATSGNGKFSLLGAGTATLTQILQMVTGIDIGFDTVSNVSGVGTAAAVSSATNTASANAATEFMLNVRGTFNVSVAGTIIPSFAQTTAAAAVVKIGSYFKIRRLGAQNVVSVGQWT